MSFQRARSLASGKPVLEQSGSCRYFQAMSERTRLQHALILEPFEPFAIDQDVVRTQDRQDNPIVRHHDRELAEIAVAFFALGGERFLQELRSIGPRKFRV